MHKADNSGIGKAFALKIRGGASSIDTRLLVLLCAGCGLCAWLLYWPVLFVLLPLALLFSFTAYMLMPGARAALLAYSSFAVFWAAGYFTLQLWEHPGSFEASAKGAAIFGLRLYCLLGLALAVPLTTTALRLGRVFTWYVQRIGWVEIKICAFPLWKGRLRPRITQSAWRCGLALAIMAAFLPRCFRVLSGLRRNLQLRAPHLSMRKKMFVLGLAALRLLSTQTWDMTISIASRDLYQPLPWNWR